jgi:hypothetical protein
MFDKLFSGIFAGILGVSIGFVWRVVVQHARVEQATTACVICGVIGLIIGLAWAQWTV